MQTEILFQETQHFRGAGLWLGFVAVAVIAIGLPLVLALRRGALNRPMLFLPAAIATIVLLLVGGLLVTARLETRVTPSGIDVQFVPFHRAPQHIGWSDVRDVRAVTVRPIHDYGGWGIRKRDGHTAYLVGGNQCVEIVRGGGTTLCIGTQQPAKLESALLSALARGTR